MKGMKFLFVVLAAALLAACAASKPAISAQPAPGNTPAGAAQPTVSIQTTPGNTVAGAVQPTAPIQPAQGLARTDSQGAVTVEVTPENLDNPGDALIFEIGMNTHSVDLSMNLAPLATLTTDNGRSVQAAEWDGPGGGHHVSGKLSFPTQVNGASFLDGAKKLTMTLRNVDAPERVFTWDLAK